MATLILAQVPFLDQNGLVSQPWLMYLLNQNSTLGNVSNLEIPTGVINGSNKTFNLVNIPNPAASCIGYVRQGGGGAFLPMIYGIDFTLSGATVTTIMAPIASSNLFFSYNY